MAAIPEVPAVPGVPARLWRVAVIGCGRWGRNLVRNFMGHPRTTLVRVADRYPSGEVIWLNADWPTPVFSRDAADVFADPAVDLVAIATPAASHYELARAALEAGKHVLVEKPLALSSGHAAGLVGLAERQGRMLAVDFTYLFSPAVAAMDRLLRGDLGVLHHAESVRANLGRHQPDIDVIWDLAPHDLAIFSHLLAGCTPEVLSAVTFRSFGPQAETTSIALRYGNVGVHLLVSWLSPVKVRRMLLVGDRQMAVWDDLEAVENLRVHDTGVLFRGDRAEYWQRGVTAPKLDGVEPLRAEVDHLVSCLDSGDRPVNDGRLGLAVVRTLEEISAKAVRA